MLVEAGSELPCRTAGSGRKLGLDANLENDPSPDLVRILLERGEDPNWANYTGNTPLMEAVVSTTDEEITRLILEAGADVNLVDDGNNTALIWAAWANKNPNVIRLLIEAGTDLEVRDYENDANALMWALRQDPNPTIIQLLVDAGAKVRTRSNTGASPLLWAAWGQASADVFEILVTAGADISTETILVPPCSCLFSSEAPHLKLFLTYKGHRSSPIIAMQLPAASTTHRRKSCFTARRD